MGHFLSPIVSKSGAFGFYNDVTVLSLLINMSFRKDFLIETDRGDWFGHLRLGQCLFT